MRRETRTARLVVPPSGGPACQCSAAADRLPPPPQAAADRGKPELHTHADAGDGIRITKFWYNDEEIFRWKQGDFNRRAERFRSQGITHVDCKSCTHFRWSFHKWWDLIADVLARIVEACHAVDIKVIEHHSATATLNPADEKEEQWMQGVLSRHHSSVESWPGLRQSCDEDPLIQGVRMSSMRQVDGRTGQWARSNYRGWVMCPTNPDFRRLYLAYLETLYALGIDGIMTDEFQLFGRGHACACQHCRELFHEWTGCEMPVPEQWESWHGDYSDASFLAWLDFRVTSIEDAHHAVKKHYDGLGLKLFRPNYHSVRFFVDTTVGCLENCPDLDVVSLECTYPHIIRYTWPFWAVETAQRFATGRRRGIPAGAISYPDRPDTILFMWALSKSWGALFLTSGTGEEEESEENRERFGRVRGWEKKHAHLFRRPEKICRLGFYDSRKTAHLYEHARLRSLKSIRAWLHACCRTNVPFDVFAEEEVGDIRDRYRVVVLNEVALLSDEEIRAFKDFASNGGTLVWIGMTGSKDAKGCDRDGALLAAALGLPNFASAADGMPSQTYAKDSGSLVTLACDTGLGADPILGYVTDRWTEQDASVPFKEESGQQRRAFAEISAFLRDRLGHNIGLTVENVPHDLLVTAFRLPDTGDVVVHIVNAVGVFDVSPGTPVSHADRIPFPGLEGKEPIAVSLLVPLASATQGELTCDYHDPMRGGVTRLECRHSGGQVRVDVPSELIREYGLLHISAAGGQSANSG